MRGGGEGGEGGYLGRRGGGGGGGGVPGKARRGARELPVSSSRTLRLGRWSVEGGRGEEGGGGVLSGLSRRRQAEYSRACLLRLSRLVGVCYDSIVRWVLLLKGGS